MLGTFSFEIYFKSYPCFTFWSLEILEISKRPFSPSSSPSALSRRRVQCSAARRRRGEPARPLLLRAGAHASCGSSYTAFGFALEPPRPCHAPPPSPEQPVRSPPRRRRGGPAAAPQGLISRAHEHYFYPRKLFLSSFRLFRAPTPQNAAAAPLELGRAHPRRRPATTDPLHPRQPHHPLRLVLA